MGLKESGLRGSLRNVSVGIDAIPESGLLHDYNVLDQSGSQGNIVSTFTDSAGSNDLSGNGTYQESQINGRDTILMDGVEDVFSGEPANFGPGNEYTYAGVCQFSSVDSGAAIFGNRGDEWAILSLEGTTEFEADHPGVTSPTGGTPDTSAFRYVMTYDGSDSYLDINGTTVINGVSQGFGSFSSENLQLAGNGNGSSLANVHLGRHLFYDEFYDATGRTEIDDALASEWGF